MNKVQIIIIIFSIIVIITAIIVFARVQAPENPGIGAETSSLTVWGVDRPEIFKDVFENYERQFRVTINYVEKDPRRFRQDVVEALAAGTHPDLVMASTDWILAQKDKLSPVPATIATPDLMETAFVDVVIDSFVETIEIERQPQTFIWALPLWVDPLVLYWNKDIFNVQNISLPPENWTSFIETSNKIKSVASGSVVQRAGSALGRAQNMPLFKEIFSLVLMQQGAALEDALKGTAFGEEMESAVRFYTDFGNASQARSGVYTWNARLPEPRDFFAEGKLGMMIDYYSYNKSLSQKASHISYDIAPAPQIENTPFPVHYADIRGVAVLRRSEFQDASWHFARWLAGAEQAALYLSHASAAPARRDLLAGNTLPHILVTGSLNAYRPREQFPDLNSSLLRDIIETVADGRFTPSEALTDAARKYRAAVEGQ